MDWKSIGRCTVVLATDELADDNAILRLTEKVGDATFAVKMHNHIDEYGPSIVRRTKDAGAQRVWDDFKFVDIDKTVRKRISAHKKAGGDIITVMANGEIDMMMAAVDTGLTVYAVTVLTSFTSELAEINFGRSVKAAVLHFSRMAKLATTHGVVCSPQEVGLLKTRRELNDLKLVTPGTRSVGVAHGDQKRVTTPAEAITEGSDILVIGSQVTLHPNPAEELQRLIEEEIGPAYLKRYPQTATA